MNAESHDHIYHENDHFPTPSLSANASLRCSFAECFDLTFNHQPSLLRHTRLKHPDSLHPIHLKSFRNSRRITQSNHVLKIALTSKIKCSLCDKWCLRQDGLVIHVMMQHTVKEVVIGGFSECTRIMESNEEIEKHQGVHKQPEHQIPELNQSINDKQLKSAQKLLFDFDSNEESMDVGDSKEDSTDETDDSDEASLEEIVLENDTDFDEQSIDEKVSDEEEFHQTEPQQPQNKLNESISPSPDVKNMENHQEFEEDLHSQPHEIQQQTFTELTNSNSIHYANDIENCNNLNQPSITTLNPAIPILINANPLPIYSLSCTLFQHPINYIYNFDPSTNVLMEPRSIQNNNSNMKTFQSNQPEYPMRQQIDQSHIELMPMQFTNAMPVQQQIFVSNIDCQQNIMSTQTQPMLYRNNIDQMTNNQVNPPIHLSTALSDSIVLQSNQLQCIIVPSSIYQFSANWDQSNPNSTQSIVHLNPPTEQSQPSEHQTNKLNELTNAKSFKSVQQLLVDFNSNEELMDGGVSKEDSTDKTNDSDEASLEEIVLKNDTDFDEQSMNEKDSEGEEFHQPDKQQSFEDDDELEKCNTQSSLACPECGKSFKSKRLVKAHIHNVHSKQLYPCEVSGCTLKPRIIYNLIRHYSDVHKGVNFPCKQCLNLKDRRDLMVNHLRTYHQIDLNKPNSIINLDQISFNCATCSKTFKSKVGFAGHLRDVHSNKQPTVKCPKCDKYFPSKQSLKTHLRAVHPKQQFHCEVSGCGKKCNMYLSLLSHYRFGHKGVNFPCVQCKKFKERKDLMLDHLRKYHQIIFENHQNHQVTKHQKSTNQSPFKCLQCDKLFTTKNRFYSHRSHVHPKKLQQCEVSGCGKTCKAFYDLLRHYGSVHKGVNFPCKQCKNYREREDLMMNHLRTYHKINFKLPASSCLNQSSPISNQPNLIDNEECVDYLAAIQINNLNFQD